MFVCVRRDTIIEMAGATASVSVFILVSQEPTPQFTNKYVVLVEHCSNALQPVCFAIKQLRLHTAESSTLVK